MAHGTRVTHRRDARTIKSIGETRALKRRISQAVRHYHTPTNGTHGPPIYTAIDDKRDKIYTLYTASVF